MKILVVGKNNLMLWPQKVHKTLKLLGHSSNLFLFNRKTPSYCLYRLLGKNFRTRQLSKKFEKQIQIFQPDLILFVSTFFIPEPFFKIAAQYKNIKKAGWSGDMFGKKQKKKANLLDILFISDTGYLNVSKTFKCKSVFLPLCADEDLCKNVYAVKTLPPFFAGVANKLRNNYLAACKTPCLIYGKGWNKEQMPQHEIHNHKILQKKMSAFIAKTVAPINICFSKNIINGLNFRVFETGISGSLIMVNAESSDISKCYHVGKQAVVYHSKKELNALLQDIVKNPVKYEKIAKAGYERTLKEHTYTQRIKQMLEKL